MNPLRGEKHPKSVISDADAYNLKRRALLGEKTTDLAKEYHISPALASNIRNGKAHPHIVIDDIPYTTGKINGVKHWMAKFTEEDIREIFRKKSLGWSIQSLAEMKDVRPCTISYILYGKTWKHVCPEIPRLKKKKHKTNYFYMPRSKWENGRTELPEW